MKLELPKLSKNQCSIHYFKPIFKTILTVCFMLSIAIAFSQTYNAPYEIPKFQNFIGECKLQGPTSSTEATQSELINGYSSSSFYVADVNKMAFNQSGSSNRTELRYLTNWTLSQGDRSMHARINIVQQTCDQVTVMQIHDDANAGNGPNKPLLRIYKHNNKTPNNHIWAVYKTDITGANNAHVDLGADPGGYFNVDIRLVNGNMIIDFEGVEKVNVDVSYWTFPSYWKAGVYLQDNGEATAYFDELYTGTPSGTNASPNISITSPANGVSFNDGDNVTISADATDSDGAVSQVEFFVNGSSVGIDSSSPYSTNWTIGVGSYDITAVATDNESASSSSSVITITGNNVGPSTELYVSNIETGTQNAGKGKKYGVATVTILDDAGAPVNGATVSGTFNGTFNESVSGTTSSDGTVVLVTSSSAKKGVTVDLCVDDVTHSSLIYNSALNIVTCTGSSMKIGQPTKNINSKFDNIGFVIYPNPSNGIVIVKLGLDKKSQYYARVISFDGKELKTIQPQILRKGNHQIELDVSHLSNGVYFVESVLNGEKRVNRFVKK